LEIIIVDGGSTDGTIESVANFQRQLGSDDFEIKLLRESDFGELRSPANARNIGVLNSRSTYLTLFDVDFELTDRSLVSKVQRKLVNHHVVRVKIVPMIDTWIEFHSSIDDLRRDTLTPFDVHAAGGYRREVFQNILFDPELGFGDDRDFAARLAISPVYVDAYCYRHYDHTFGGWTRQALWYGRTFPQFLKKYWKVVSPRKKLVNPYVHMAYYTAGVGLLIIALVVEAGFVSPTLSIIALGFFLAKVLYHYAKSPSKRSWRLLYIFVRETYYGLCFVMGLVLSHWWRQDERVARQ
jgi:glycosyltransferase involved in cell wall biosynthesis